MSRQYAPRHSPAARQAPEGRPAHVPRHAIAGQVLADACAVSDARAEQDRLWDRGFTRRRFIAGAGMVGAAALGSQLVTSRVAYAASPETASGNTLITVFLRGGMDGLRLLAPMSSALGGSYLHSVRPGLVPPDAKLSGLGGGWGLHTALAPLMPFWTSGEFALVPAVSTAGVTRSHFQAQNFLETGGVPTGSSGWLDRLLQRLGPGTTFRAMSEGASAPASMEGAPVLVMNSLQGFTFPGWSGVTTQSIEALQTLYRGFDGPLGEDVPTTFAALTTAAAAQAKAGAQHGAVYPAGPFGQALGDLATLLRAEVGLEVATVDVGGWDTHTDETTDLDLLAATFASTLAAFLTDLGPARRQRVTVAVMTEFGRRVQANDSGGSDHGHGSVAMLLGGGVVGGVRGRWLPLSDSTLDQGDVPGLNDAFDVLGEVAQKRLGLGSLSTVFPGHDYQPLGLVKTG